MRNIWEKIKAFFVGVWEGLSVAGRILVGLILIGLVGLVVYAAYGGNENKDQDKDKTPDVAQVYEPSIGTPLPADNPDQPASRPGGAVGGAATTEPSTPQQSGSGNFVAPPSGVDPNEPVKYQNNDLKFAATLPVGSDVKEEGSRIIFNSAGGKLHYIVSVNEAGSDTLSAIESQLHNSPTVSNISHAEFSNLNALKFDAKGFGAGVVFVANGKIYYLLGNSQLFSDFRII